MLGVKSKLRRYFTYKALPSEEEIFKNNNFDKENFEKFYNEGLIKFKSQYDYYVSTISIDHMAASLECCACLYASCRVLNPTKVVDLGSGISSYVFRVYKREYNNDLEVFSIDDNKDWLEKTKKYLMDSSLDVSNIFTLEYFLELDNYHSYDIIFHDLNFVEERIKFVDQVVSMSKQHGVIIFDDIHKDHYFEKLSSFLKKRKIAFYSLKKYTLDKFNRFSMIAIN